MSMGGPGDHPIGDLIHYGQSPFPPDIAALVRELYSLDPKMRDTFALDAFDWEAGRALDEGRAKLRAELQKHRTRQS
jgi:hypothetical protein